MTSQPRQKREDTRVGRRTRHGNWGEVAKDTGVTPFRGIRPYWNTAAWPPT